jgi:hypothetical protein
MDALRGGPRIRLAPILEWVIAAVFLFATVAVGSMILAQLRPAQATRSVPPPRPLVASIPPAVPARAVSVPMLPFLDGKDVKVGETFAAVAARLGRSAELGRQEVDRGSLGDRMTRFYEYSGYRFILVFEPFERNGVLRVAAIYLP